MAVTIVGTASSPAVAAVSPPEADRATLVRLVISGISTLDGYVCLGVAASQPATFGDMTTSTSSDLLNVDSCTYSFGPPKKVQLSWNAGMPGYFTTGAHLWVGWKDSSGAPSSGDALVGVISLGILG